MIAKERTYKGHENRLMGTVESVAILFYIDVLFK